MWSHLVELTKDKRTTVMITTHYIEEAKSANRVRLPHARVFNEINMISITMFIDWIDAAWPPLGGRISSSPTPDFQYHVNGGNRFSIVPQRRGRK